MDFLDALNWLLTVPPHSTDSAQFVRRSLIRLAPIVLTWPECPTQLRDILAAAAQQEADPPTEWIPARRGWIDDAPLHAALWEQPWATCAVSAAIAQATLLTAAAIIQIERGDLAERLSPLRKAGLAVRRIVAGDCGPLDSALERDGPPASLAGVVARIEGVLEVASLPIATRGHALALRRVCLDAQELCDPRHRDAEGASHEAVSPDLSPASGNPSLVVRELDGDGEFVVFSQLVSVDPDAVAEGASPVPEQPQAGFVVVRASAAEDAQLSRRQQWRRAHFRAKALVTRAQGLRCARGHLQLVDLIALHAALADPRFAHDDALGKTVRAAVALSLLTGRSIQRLADTVLAPLREGLPDDAVRGESPSIVASGGMRLPTLALEHGFRPSASSQHRYRQSRHYIDLALPRIFGTWPLALVGEGLARPFSCTNRIEPAAAEFLRRANRKYGGRLTLRRVESFLAGQIYARTGDWADAALVTSNGRLNQARCYYYAPSSTHLSSVYAQVWRGVHTALLRAGAEDVPPVEASSRARNVTRDTGVYHVGSHGCPTDEAVAELMAALAGWCSDALSGRKFGAATAHNALAGYTFVIALWLTGARPVVEAVDLTQLDDSSGFFAIEDKTGDAHYSARVAWLPPRVRAQIDRYRARAKTLETTVGADLSRRFFFVLDGHAVEPSRAVLARVLPDYPLAWNAHRHWLRTRLRELGVRGDTVDALLGHGARGQEPYRRYSCLSPAAMRQEAAPALEKLSRRMKWQLIPGR